ncbi:hypothetical protein EVAR_18197_1 [Eumeta japonica]|uniref:Uncharacterized protein n=1 Tax=Eumeta variegata TaxID=151549 RepID=A0A4C1UVD2_EUMVA|nr:hypothetical protein EVAR_18197_1 [Eumeta japonica]
MSGSQNKKLRVVTNDAQAGSERSTRSAAHGARIRQHTRTQDGVRSPPWASGVTSTAYLPEVVRTRGRRGNLVSWRPIPLRHAEACAAGRCWESTAHEYHMRSVYRFAVVS